MCFSVIVADRRGLGVMAGTAGFAVVGLVLVLLVVLELPLSVEAIKLRVTYPDKVNMNFSFVNLTCLTNFNDPLGPATFWRNGTEQITQGSGAVVSVTSSNEFSIAFVFNQRQEGKFACMAPDPDNNGGILTSEAEYLAGKYNNVTGLM